MPATADLLKQRYCKTDNSACARWMIRSAVGAELVPLDLFPYQQPRAERLIAEQRA